MIILDTMILSALMRPRPEEPVLHWINRQPAGMLRLTAVNIFEVRFGLHLLPDGRRKDALDSAFERILRLRFRDYILELNTASGELAAAFLAARQIDGRPTDVGDSMIAGIALANGAAIATRNRNDFEGAGIDLIDPWVE